MSKMYLVKPDGIDAEWNATNYGENEYTQLSMKMRMYKNGLSVDEISKFTKSTIEFVEDTIHGY